MAPKSTRKISGMLQGDLGQLPDAPGMLGRRYGTLLGHSWDVPGTLPGRPGRHQKRQNDVSGRSPDALVRNNVEDVTKSDATPCRL